MATEGQEYAGEQMQQYGSETATTEKPVEYEHQPVAAEQPPNPEEAVAPNTEEERLWGIVNANPADFNSWTQLIQETEKLDDIVKFRQYYDTFLAEFPLCYGYWKKYADHEHRLATPEKAIEVYERAVKAVTYSVEIWAHYCSYVASVKPEDPEELRRLFERGLSYVGTDYLAHQLWDKYIELEYSHQNLVGIMQLYTRIFQIPLQALERYYTHFLELASNRPLSELKAPDEVTEDKATVEETEEHVKETEEVVKDTKDSVKETKESVTEEPVKEAQEPVKEEGKPTEESMKESEKPTKDPEVEKFIKKREDLYKATMEWEAKIHDFEGAIKRPYFHVRPLDDAQLLNWHRYLDFLEREADFDKVVKLYERCLIACANYPEYWIRYVHSMDAKNRSDIAEDALDRATRIFVKRRSEIHMYAAHYKESKGDAAGARKEYTILSSEIVPGLLEVISKHANFEKRQGEVDAACAIYESALEVEKAKEDSRVLPFLYVKYARFLYGAGLLDKAKEIIDIALARLPYSKVILEAAIHFETLCPGEKEIQKLESVVDRAILANGQDVGLTNLDCEEISTLFLEFLDFYGTTEEYRQAETRHRQQFTYTRGVEIKKRPATDGGLLSDRPKVFKTATTAVVPATTAVYPNGQTQWTYQTWQQQPQQQWPQATYPASYNYYAQYPQQQTYTTATYPQTTYQQDGNWTTAHW